jgi:hypothetical protein
MSFKAQRRCQIVKNTVVRKKALDTQISSETFIHKIVSSQTEVSFNIEKSYLVMNKKFNITFSIFVVIADNKFKLHQMKYKQLIKL